MKDGFLFIDKPSGITSRKFCNQISFKFEERKVGHIGTLDPFATGLLIVTLGKANKAGAFLEKADKTYVASLKLGEETDTLDNTGVIVLKKTIPQLSNSDIENVFISLTGEISQIPPMTSAIHVNGTKLYKLAHKGIEVEREPRNVRVNYIKLIEFKDNILTFECSVSSGTYIRVLAKDIANKLGTVGHLISLRRTAVGNFNVDKSVSLDESSDNDINKISYVLKTIYPYISYDENTCNKIMSGNVKTIEYNSNSPYLLVLSNTDEPIAMYAKIKAGTYEFKRGLF